MKSNKTDNFSVAEKFFSLPYGEMISSTHGETATVLLKSKGEFYTSEAIVLSYDSSRLQWEVVLPNGETVYLPDAYIRNRRYIPITETAVEKSEA